MSLPFLSRATTPFDKAYTLLLSSNQFTDTPLCPNPNFSRVNFKLFVPSLLRIGPASYDVTGAGIRRSDFCKIFFQ